MLITYDPGITTGWATYSEGRYNVGQFNTLNLTSIHNHLSYCGDCEPTIGYENFKHRPQLIHSELYSMQVIGVIRLWAQQRELQEPFNYLPATAKAFWTNQKIKALSLWTPGSIHAMDALRVLLKYRMDNDKVWFNSISRNLH